MMGEEGEGGLRLAAEKGGEKGPKAGSRNKTPIASSRY